MQLPHAYTTGVFSPPEAFMKSLSWSLYRVSGSYVLYMADNLVIPSGVE